MTDSSKLLREPPQAQTPTASARPRATDDRKTLMMPVYEANAYEKALTYALTSITDAETHQSLVRLRDRISGARVGHWGRR